GRREGQGRPGLRGVYRAARLGPAAVAADTPDQRVAPVDDGPGGRRQVDRRVRGGGGGALMDPRTVKLAPSILAAGFARLGEQVLEAEKAGADRIHVDVMDGHLVPNISIGPLVVRSLRPVTKLPLETHLMISDPDKYIDDFVKAGSDSVIVH